jgi:bifunctional NMN adenylyltransferase/nudix hydrolase
MSKEFGTLVFIGRFQPLHIGHEKVIREALNKAKEVIIIVGSSFSARTFKNPYTFEERKTMIESVFPGENLKVFPVSDYPFDDNKWVSVVQKIVYDNYTKYSDFVGEKRIGLIGHSKDSSSYYLKIFRGWGSVEVENYNSLNATDVRKTMYGDNPASIADYLSSPVLNFVTSYAISMGEKTRISAEYWDMKRIKDEAATLKRPQVFVTTDAVVTQSGSVLLVRRKNHPFKGYWALPGGYLEQDKTLVDNMIKELREETRLKIPPKIIKGSIKNTMVVDTIDRDPRGRILTHAYYIDLGYPEEALPKVAGGDDAVEARWFLFSDVKQDQMAFDHWHILIKFGVL